jgi:hypothetical protein
VRLSRNAPIYLVWLEAVAGEEVAVEVAMAEAMALHILLAEGKFICKSFNRLVYS